MSKQEGSGDQPVRSVEQIVSEILIGCDATDAVCALHPEVEEAARDENRKQITALIASALREARQQEWRPIETAPKDGTEVLLTDGHYKRVGNWAQLRNCWAVDAIVPLPDATHWCPIPPRAAASSGAQGEK